MNYLLFQQLQQKAIPAVQVCRVLAVSYSGFYAAQQRLRQSATLCIDGVHLQADFTASGNTYGSRCLQTSLRRQGLQVGELRQSCRSQQ